MKRIHPIRSLCTIAAVCLCLVLLCPVLARAAEQKVLATSSAAYQGQRCYRYDRQGRVVHEFETAGDWTAELTYYSNGQLRSRTEHDGYFDSVWYYDEQGHLIEDPSYTYRYKLDNQGRVAEKSVYDNGVLNGQYRYNYYSGGGYQLIYTNFSELDGRKIENFVSTMSFDSRGNIISNSRSGPLYGEYEYTYEYDSHGNQTLCRKVSYDWDGAKQVTTTTSENNYGRDGVLLSVSSTTVDNGEYTYRSVYYSYDSAGRLIRITDSSYPQSQRWEYDSEGNLLYRCCVVFSNSDPIDNYIWGEGYADFTEETFTYKPLSQLLAQ